MCDLTEEDLKRINNFVEGRVVKRIDYNVSGDSNLDIHFEGGSYLTLSTLGGVELEEMG